MILMKLKNLGLNTMESAGKYRVLLTFDVEDWFQVENFKAYIPVSSWSSYELRVEKNTHLILDLLDSFPFKVEATFFVLGWVAKKLPNLIAEIDRRGHEVASHGNHHHICTKLSPKTLLSDLADSKNLIEDILGRKIYGFRAPNFAINDDTLRLVKKAGYLYDSSYNSFSMHGRYGSINLPKTKVGVLYQFSEDFYEIPITNLSVFKNKIIPLGGGGYFRLYPSLLFNFAARYALLKEGFFVYYSHPWEFDPEQPKVYQAAPFFKLRHYINLNKTALKLNQFIDFFSFCDFVSCRLLFEQEEILDSV